MLTRPAIIARTKAVFSDGFFLCLRIFYNPLISKMVILYRNRYNMSSVFVYFY
nr:MAG TPA: hypothetical protein [Caudoviricetes sp.]